MKKILLIILVQALFVSCVQEIQEAVSGKKEKSEKSTSAIEGSVSAILNAFISQAHAGNSLLCQSSKSSGSEVYAKLIGVKSNGSKEDVCDTDIISGNYRFDIKEEALNLEYKGLIVEVIDNRSPGNKQFEGRKAIVDINSRKVDINPETSIKSQFIEHLFLAEVFSSADPEQMLIDKKNDLSISKISTILPDIFADGSDADNASTAKVKMFFENKKDDTTLLEAVKVEAEKTIPVAIDKNTLGDMCDVNIKSSHDCYKLLEESGCYVEYMNMENSAPYSSCSDSKKLEKMEHLIINYTDYIRSGVACSGYGENGGDAMGMSWDRHRAIDENDTNECEWERGFYLYTMPGNNISRKGLNYTICTDSFSCYQNLVSTSCYAEFFDERYSPNPSYNNCTAEQFNNLKSLVEGYSNHIRSNANCSTYKDSNGEWLRNTAVNTSDANQCEWERGFYMYTMPGENVSTQGVDSSSGDPGMGGGDPGMGGGDPGMGGGDPGMG